MKFLAVTAGIYILILILRNLSLKSNSKIIITAYILGFSAMINDILHANLIISSAYILPYTIIILIILQAGIITKRNFKKLFHTAETNADKLILMNLELLDEITKSEKLELELRQSNEQITYSRFAIMMGLAKLAEFRDRTTGQHLERIREYSKLLAQKLSENNIYNISDEYIDDIYYSSILHDIGKVAVPDALLFKEGPLTEDEFRIMKEHPLIGGRAVENIELQMNMDSFLSLGKEIAYSHHEKWDGSGYPLGLKGDEIPLSARIVALADVYDALTSERPYKEAFSHETAHSIIIEGKGSHFDPDIVDAYLDCSETFKTINMGFGKDLLMTVSL